MGTRYEYETESDGAQTFSPIAEGAGGGHSGGI